MHDRQPSTVEISISLFGAGRTDGRTDTNFRNRVSEPNDALPTPPLTHSQNTLTGRKISRLGGSTPQTPTDTYIQIYTCTYTYIRIYMYTRIHIYMYTYIHIYVYTYIHIYIYTYIHIYNYTYTYTHTYTCTYTYTYTYTYINIYI